VGLTLPSELTEPLGWIGLTWPEADEELLFEAGQRWMSYAEQVQQVAQEANARAAQVWQTSSGDAVDAFEEWWTRQDGPSRRLAEDAAAALLIGGALMAFAAITLALKIAFIVQLIILAVEVAQAIATAFVTFGATTAEVPGFIAASRVICRELIQQVITHITTVIKDIFERASQLLKRFDGRAAKVDPQILREFDDILQKDIRSVNPRFNPPHPSYSANCIHCVQAYEMRRRGFDVSASSLPPHFWPSRGRPLEDLEHAWGRGLTAGGRADIEAAFLKAGHGSRGVVYIAWKRGGAHVFNVENVHGAVRFVDGQSGMLDASSHFAHGQGTAFVRLDDLSIGHVHPFLEK
jgi:hypothetical protein